MKSHTTAAARRPSRPPAFRPGGAAARRDGRCPMSPVARVAAVLALLLAAVCGGLTAGAAPAAAAALPMAQCTTTSGVVLAVDFSHWGGPLLRSCGTTPTTGYALLNQGGWQTTGTQHDGPAFVCRIGYAGYQGGTQYPTGKQESCVLTPPATAYWSYWHADPGKNTWSYSQSGAMSYHPKPGGVDLWIFGATDVTGTQGRPTFSPDTVRAHNTKPGGTTTPGGASSGGTTSGGASSGGASSGGAASSGGTSSGGGSRPPATDRPTAGTAPTSAHPSTAAPSTVPTPSPDTSAASGTIPAPGADTAATPSPTAPRTQDAEPTAAVGHSSGSVLPALVTAAALAVIAVLIVLRVRRRGRAE